MSAIAEQVNLRDPDDIVDAILHRQALSLPGDGPWELYAALRGESPVHESEAEGMIVLTRYADCLKALLHRGMDLGPKLREAAAQGNLMSETFSHTMLYFEDPADTLRQRRLVRQAFTRQTVQGLRPTVEELVNGLLDKCQAQGEFDVFHDFADHVPVRVVCDLLGVPTADVPKFRDWTRLMAPATGAIVTEDTMRKVEEAIQGLRSYITALIGELRTHPNDALLSKMISARDEGHQLSEDELVGLSIFILAAGSDTTTQLITGGIAALSKFPDERRKLQEDPDRITSALEELIRHSGPVHYAQPRTLLEPLEIADRLVNAGETVFVSVGAANRDPEQFSNPDALDLEREDVRHLGFSQGIHLCIGAMLARLEGEIAIRAVVERFPDLQVHQDPIDYLDLGPMRGIAALKASAS